PGGGGAEVLGGGGGLAGGRRHSRSVPPGGDAADGFEEPREDRLLDRRRLLLFPLRLGGWRGGLTVPRGVWAADPPPPAGEEVEPRPLPSRRERRGFSLPPPEGEVPRFWEAEGDSSREAIAAYERAISLTTDPVERA